jgi:hypothetical protein
MHALFACGWHDHALLRPIDHVGAAPGLCMYMCMDVCIQREESAKVCRKMQRLKVHDGSLLPVVLLMVLASKSRAREKTKSWSCKLPCRGLCIQTIDRMSGDRSAGWIQILE